MQSSFIFTVFLLSVFSIGFTQSRYLSYDYNYRYNYQPIVYLTTPIVYVRNAGSTWDWTLIPPTQPVQPNPISLERTGTLVYRADIFKNPNGVSPSGVFTIQASILIRSDNPATFDNVYVMLTGPGVNNRYDANSCVPNDHVLSMNGIATCNVNINDITLQGQTSSNGGISFQGYALQPFIDYEFKFGFRNSGQLAGVLTPLVIQDIYDDCATFTQTFEPSGPMPTSTTLGTETICFSKYFTWMSTFTFRREDCQGSNSTNYPRQIVSNFRLTSHQRLQQSLSFNAMTNVAYINCSS